MDANRFAYLNKTALDWPRCLAHSLGYVRQSWATQWVGLPCLLEHCADFLHLNQATLTPTTACLLAAARELAIHIEAESASTSAAAEPPYHNRLHFADVLTAMTVQVAIEGAHCKAQCEGEGEGEGADWQAAMLLIALAHDFRHCGGVNAHAAQMEQQSFDALQPFLERHGLAPGWAQRIHTVIVRSDFVAVPENHRRVSGLAFAWCTDWATVLLNEADTMASASPIFGPAQGHALAAEWARAQLPAHGAVATAQGRRDFLNSLAFSSYSATVLGAPEAVAAQLARPGVVST
jgi:hypothetical protein